MLSFATPVSRLAGLDTTAAPPRVVASFGVGVDSTAMLVRWMNEPASRDFELSELAVVTAMVGDEYDSTVQAVSRLILPRFTAAGVRFIQVAGRSQRQRALEMVSWSWRTRLLRSVFTDLGPIPSQTKCGPQEHSHS